MSVEHEVDGPALVVLLEVVDEDARKREQALRERRQVDREVERLLLLELVRLEQRRALAVVLV